MSTKSERYRPKADHSHPSRPDLTRSFAVVVSAPGYMYPKGGYRESEGVWREEPDWTRERLSPVIQQFTEYIRQNLPPGVETTAEAIAPANYVFGPVGRAGMYEAVHYVVQIVSDATTIADDVQVWVGIGGWALWLKGQWRGFLEHARKEGNTVHDRDQISLLTPPGSSRLPSTCNRTVRAGQGTGEGEVVQSAVRLRKRGPPQRPRDVSRLAHDRTRDGLLRARRPADADRPLLRNL
jgi:hypothetical protein